MAADAGTVVMPAPGESGDGAPLQATADGCCVLPWDPPSIRWSGRRRVGSVSASASVLRSAIVSSSRFRVEVKEHGLEGGEVPTWSVVVTDTTTSEEIASYPPTFVSEGEARE